MKFEKFVKGCGTYGQVYTRPNGEKWLICEGVGMLIPHGVNNLLGVGEVPERIKTLVESLIMADTTDRVELTRATVSADGKAKDIVRWFGDDSHSYNIGIDNADFGLLERKDINLALVEVEDDEDELLDNKYLLVLDQSDNVIGFIKEK